MVSRTWIKLYCKEWLEGSLKTDSLELRGFWSTLLAVAGGGQYGDSGVIKIAEKVGLTHHQLGQIVGIPYRRVGYFMAKLTKQGRISYDSDGVIYITNWQKYQSEYCRQKPYREAKRDSNSYSPKLQGVVTRQVTVEKEKENREGEVK